MRRAGGIAIGVDTQELEWIWMHLELGGELPGWTRSCEDHIDFLERGEDAARWWRVAPDGPWLPVLDGS